MYFLRSASAEAEGEPVLIVHYPVKTDPVAGTAATVGLERKILDPVEPIPPGAIWIDMVEPTVDEDRKVERLSWLQGAVTLRSRFRPAGRILLCGKWRALPARLRR